MRGDLGDFIHDFGWALVVPVRSCQHRGVTNGEPIRHGLTRGRDGSFDMLDAALAIGEGSLLLEVAGCGKNHIGKMACLRKENFLHDEELEFFECCPDVGLVGVALHDVLALDPQSMHGSFRCSIDHFRYG